LCGRREQGLAKPSKSRLANVDTNKTIGCGSAPDVSFGAPILKRTGLVVEWLNDLIGGFEDSLKILTQYFSFS